MTEKTTRLMVKGPAELLTVVPYWLGYHPHNCVVIMMRRNSQVKIGCSLLLRQCADPPVLDDLATMLDARQRGAGLLLIAYGRSDKAWDALGKVTDALSAHPVELSLLVDGDRFWVCSAGERPITDPGHEVGSAISPAAAAAVQAGLQVYTSRDEVVQLVRGPDDDDDEARFLWSEAVETMARLDIAARKHFVDECLAEGVEALHQPGAQRCAQLGVAVQQTPVRDHAWLAMDLDDGWRHQQLWLWVLRVTPAEHAPPVLCLAAVASWLSGGGAVLTECINRCEALRPEYSMLALVREVHDFAVPPTMWRKLGRTRRARQRHCWSLPVPD